MNQFIAYTYTCTLFISFSADRSKNVSIRFRIEGITSAIEKNNIHLDDSKWREVTKLDAYGEVGIVNLDEPKLARYVAVRRRGLINLKEVQIYSRSSECFHSLLKSHQSVSYFCKLKSSIDTDLLLPESEVQEKSNCHCQWHTKARGFLSCRT